MNNALFDTSLLKKSSDLLNTLDHPLRLNILQAIHNKGKMTVTEIYIQFRLEQSVASLHLRNLREAKFVLATRVGKFVYYSVNHTRLKEVNQVIEDFSKVSFG